MSELNGVFVDLGRPLAAVDDLERREAAHRFRRLAQHADADLDERLTGLGGVSALAGDELLHRAADRVVQLRVVLWIPAAEVAVAAGLQVEYLPRPVEPGG